MADTPRTLSTLIAQLADNTSGNITAQVVRDMLVSLYPSREIKSKDQLLKSADEALYRAKNEGRDRICVFQQQGYLYRPDVPPSTPPKT